MRLIAYIQDLERRIGELEQSDKEQRSVITMLQKEKQELRSENQDLRRELVKVKKLLREVIGEEGGGVEELLEKFAQLEEENERMREDLKALQDVVNENSLLKTQVAALDEKNRALAAENLRLSLDNDVLKKRIKELVNPDGGDGGVGVDEPGGGEGPCMFETKPDGTKEHDYLIEVGYREDTPMVRLRRFGHEEEIKELTDMDLIPDDLVGSDDPVKYDPRRFTNAFRDLYKYSEGRPDNCRYQARVYFKADDPQYHQKHKLVDRYFFVEAKVQD